MHLILSKTFVRIGILTCSVVSFAYAGGMGPVVMSPILYTFFGAEGGYTWNDIDRITFNSTDADGTVNDIGATSIQNSGGSARLYAGLMRLMYGNSLYFSGEVGWGYYGKSTLTLHDTTFDNSSNLNGSTLTGPTHEKNLDLFIQSK